MKPQEVYIPVPVEERLPSENGNYLADTGKWDGLAKIRFIDGEWIDDMNDGTEESINDFVTHWLEKKEGYFMTEDELKAFAEKVRRYFIENTQHVPQADNAVYVMGSTDDFFSNWLNTK